jgi:hypothetical protein
MTAILTASFFFALRYFELMDRLLLRLGDGGRYHGWKSRDFLSGLCKFLEDIQISRKL